MDHRELVDYLRERDLLSNSEPKVTPLAGGVSSDVMLVQDGDQRFVVKQALEKLRVKDDWRCDTTRNTTEYDAIHFASTVFPDAVPKLLHVDRDRRLFLMEYFDEEFTPWKSHLLQGSVDCSLAERAAELLAKLHSQSWLQPELQRRFDTGAEFFALRIDPYLLTTGERHPDLRHFFQAEADRLQATSLALVHGDWSAKNMLVSGDRLVVLDWEVAWFGDPAFDSAFFLNLLYLKSLLNRHWASRYFELIQVFRDSYLGQLPQFDSELACRIVHLTLLLMLARIDGKSPVEYITTDADKNLVRTFVGEMLQDNVANFDVVDRRWRKALGVR